MFNFFKKFFDYNEREISRLRQRVQEINKLEDKARILKDNEFKKETQKLKQKINGDSKKLDDFLPWSFALVRECARRALGQRHFDVQLMAGLALHEGKIAEQKTGEGKTLSATTALYLNALVGKGVHLVTVNDYLARRDAGWMGQIFGLLGMRTSAIISDKSFIFDESYTNKEAVDWRMRHLVETSRGLAYEADITYGVNSEFGFDYLRDNMAGQVEQLSQRGFYFAIVDEADSVLIDEARTPHIISAPYDEDTSKYYRYAQIVKSLDSKSDYIVDEKLKTANLTESGITKIEKSLGVVNIYEKDFETLFHIEAALKAATLFKVDRDYIVKEREVIIVDEFTGRLLYGRRFSEGLHQAIEAKEGVSIQKESKTLATVSLQNYFRMYEKLAGMTGTAATEAEEFHKIYNTDVVVVPTHMKMVRKDTSDMIYKKEHGKFKAVVDEIVQNYQNGRPVLVGTTSIEKNEHLSTLLKQKGIPHELLNAKNHEREAQILAAAGNRAAVTVATNMAGRGVDIILGGEPPGQSKKNEKDLKKAMQEWQKKHDEVVGLGGLYVIGTEKHESRRIDNQLRGRSGRQGDPGESRFFVSLEDDLMRIFGGEQISKLMTFFNFPEDQPLTHSMVSKAIEQAQVKVEGFNFDIRKHLVDYDDVLNKQRDIIYSLRRKILNLPQTNRDEFRETVLTVFNEEVEELTSQHFFDGVIPNEENIKLFGKEMNFILDVEKNELNKFLKSNHIAGLNEFLKDKIKAEFKAREKKIGTPIWFDIIRSIFLSTIDKYWTEHLTSIEDLREGINLRGYAQLDPLVEYKNEAFSMFERLIADINFEVTRRLFKIELVEETPKIEVAEKQKTMVYKSASRVDPFTRTNFQKSDRIAENLDGLTESDPKQVQSVPQQQQPQQESSFETGFRVIPPGQSTKKPGRNDPCWCGSGKKYKKCHYPN